MLKEGSKEYERRANALARDYVDIKPCKKCGNPHVDGYCCPTCKDENPNWTREQQAAWERKYGK